MRRLSTLFFAVLAATVSALAASPQQAAEPEAHVVAKKVCLSAAETREQIKASHLVEPFAVLKFAAQHFKAEALSAKLCRIEDEFVYEIALLHRDGKYIHAHVNAATGKLIETKHSHEAAAKN